MRLSRLDQVAVALARAIRAGDLAALERLLGEHPGLAGARLEDGKGGSGTPLHTATDWPGHFPEGARVVAALIAAGADPNAAVAGSWHRETPLHWAASSDDVDAAVALIDGGADLEARGGSIAGGTPLDNAVGYGQWQVARLLVDRGARVDRLWHAAALGMMARLEALLAAGPASSEINDAFWQACHGGQPRAAARLLALGADPRWIPGYAKHTPLEIATAVDGRRQVLADWLRLHGA